MASSQAPVWLASRTGACNKHSTLQALTLQTTHNSRHQKVLEVTKPFPLFFLSVHRAQTVLQGASSDTVHATSVDLRCALKLKDLRKRSFRDNLICARQVGDAKAA
jgi:hypothetical protein